MAYSALEKKILAIAEPIAKKLEYEIYHLAFEKEGPHYFLRVFITSDNGVDLDHCESISRELGEALDNCNTIEKAYILEVSSPGLERVLYEGTHFTSAINCKINVKLYKSIVGAKNIVGILNSADDQEIIVDNVKIEKTNIAKANIVFDFEI